MKRRIGLILCIILCLCVLFGCNKDEGENNSSTIEALFGQSANEIFTYEKVDYSKTQLVLSKTGNISCRDLNRAFEAKYPNIQIIELDITGGNSDYVPAQEWVRNGDIPDIMVTSGSFVNDEYVKQYFTDLSNNPATSRFQVATMNDISIDQHVYKLPGLSKLSAIAYNKTMFDRNGWSVPTTVDEFVALCNTIRVDEPTVEPFNPNAKYSNEITVLIEGLCYGEVFAGVDNRQWLRDFINGDATYASHMQPMYDVITKLIDNDIIKESHFSYSATTRGKEFTAGNIAMINGPLNNYENSESEIGFFPFPSSTSGGKGWVVEELDSEIAVPKKERSAAVQDAVNKYLDFYASAEGQTAFIGKSAYTSNLETSLFTQSGNNAAVGLMDAINAGNKFSQVKFYNDTASVSISFSGEILAMINGLSAADSMRRVDNNCREVPVSTPATAIAEATENFSILEVSNMFADMFREETGADIGLITSGVAYRGNLMKIYKGTVTDHKIEVLMPRSYANGSKLVKLKMTGTQLLNALNKPVGNDRVEDCVYAFSGLKCKVAPWNALGSKMLSVTLADGSPIDPAKLYTVACWEGTIYDEFITETVSTYGNYNASESSPDNSFTALLTKYLTAKQTIAPSKDGRIELVWQ